MIKLLILSLAVLLLAASTSALPKPEAPLTLFAQDRLAALVRTQKQISKGGKYFRGKYNGEYTSFGAVGRYNGGFSGVTRGKRTNGKFYGKCKGKTSSMGMTGSYQARYGGKFFLKKTRKTVVGGINGHFKWGYWGSFDGVKADAKAVGNFGAKIYGKSLVVTEWAKFTMNVGGKRVKGVYFGKFDGKTFAAKITGRAGGKKFSFKYEVMLEGALANVSNKGRYTVYVNGKKFSGKYNSNNSMLPAQ